MMARCGRFVCNFVCSGMDDLSRVWHISKRVYGESTYLWNRGMKRHSPQIVGTVVIRVVIEEVYAALRSGGYWTHRAASAFTERALSRPSILPATRSPFWGLQPAL